MRVGPAPRLPSWFESAACHISHALIRDFKHKRAVPALLLLAGVAAVGLTGCSDISGSIDTDKKTGWAGETETDVSIDNATGYDNKQHAKGAITAGHVPEGIPANASDIKVSVGDKLVTASWKGGLANDPSCSVDASAKLPEIPTVIRHEVKPKGDIEVCDAGHQTSAGGYTYFWTPAS